MRTDTLARFEVTATSKDETVFWRNQASRVEATLLRPITVQLYSVTSPLLHDATFSLILKQKPSPGLNRPKCKKNNNEQMK